MDGQCSDWHVPTQRRVDVQSAKVLADGLQLGGHALHAGREEVEATLSLTVEALFDVLHEGPADRLHAEHAHCTVVRLNRYVRVLVVRGRLVSAGRRGRGRVLLDKHRVQDVIVYSHL